MGRIGVQIAEKQLLAVGHQFLVKQNIRAKTETKARKCSKNFVQCRIMTNSRMADQNLNWIANFIWGIADDVLRDRYFRGKYVT